MHSIYSVTQVNAYIKNMFTQDFLLASISIKGEVSNCKYHSSGHIYFTLKDQNGTISCIMFAGNRQGLAFRLTEGLQVVVRGSVEVYERDGKYQLYAKEISLEGAGAFYEKFILLKKELEEMGMFSEVYKKTIPANCKRLGIVTASTGAAVRDIIQVAHRRNPYLQIILYPAVVQGELAAASIVKGIEVLDKLELDVIIVGRGGGSMEDLWAFNEQNVAQAIFDAKTPIISAVGHETDVTIADFVADLRAATPSVAAELAVTEVTVTLEKIEQYRNVLKREISLKLEKERDKAERLQLRLRHQSPWSKIREMRTYLLQTRDKIENSMQSNLRQSRHMLSLLAERMNGVSPVARLAPGYGFITDDRQKVVLGVEAVDVLDLIKIEMMDGELKAKVLEKKTIRRNPNEESK